MRGFGASAILLLFGCAAASSVAGQRSTDSPQPRPIVIIGGTLIDGSGATPRHNDGILIADGRIKALGHDAVKRQPKDARLIDASGKWILPGLVDGHVHFFQTGGLDARPDLVPHPKAVAYRTVVDGIRRNPQPYLSAYLCSGITSVVDPGGAMWGFDLRDGRADDAMSPRIAFSGPLLATFDPPALELGDDDPLWLMKDASGVAAMVERLSARHPDMIKIWFVHRPADDLQKQSELVRAAIQAIHAKSIRAAVHATTLETARAAVDAGADILVHSVGDREVDRDFVHKVVGRKIIYISTLTVGRSYREVRMRQIEFEPFERQCAPAATIESFSALAGIPETALPRPGPSQPDQLPVQMRNLKVLADAGAIVAAGTDAGNTRTLHGPSLHREFVLMAQAGLKPMAILVSATRHGALLMGRDKDLGELRAGMLADVLVLDADPLADITNTRRIFKVIRGGSVFQ